MRANYETLGEFESYNHFIRRAELEGVSEVISEYENEIEDIDDNYDQINFVLNKLPGEYILYCFSSDDEDGNSSDTFVVFKIGPLKDPRAKLMDLLLKVNPDEMLEFAAKINKSLVEDYKRYIKIMEVNL